MNSREIDVFLKLLVLSGGNSNFFFIKHQNKICILNTDSVFNEKFDGDVSFGSFCEYLFLEAHLFSDKKNLRTSIITEKRQ